MKKPYQEIRFELISIDFRYNMMKSLSDLDDNELPFEPEEPVEP